MTAAGNPVGAAPRSSVWLMSPDYRYGWEHGGHLRTFALMREWVRGGGAVHLAVLDFKRDDPAVRRAYLERLRDERVITSSMEVPYRTRRVQGWLGRLAVHPALASLALRDAHGRATDAVLADARPRRPEVFVVADRHWPFAVPALRRVAPVVVEWTDSFVLALARQTRLAARERRGAALAQAVGLLASEGLSEWYYARRADANVFVSGPDAHTIGRLTHRADRTHVIPNGARDLEPPATRDRVPDRIIYTGNMDFPPNHAAAVWFIREVLPLVVARRPGVRFVAAGANPLPELRALAGGNVEVTGFVPDMKAEIARSALYVAPMVSGSGFKNKVVEALVAGTYVVGTPMALEFLPSEIRGLLSSAGTPADFADAVVAFLDDPAAYEARVGRFPALVRAHFDWSARARELAEVASAARARRAA